jgi:ETC complex I subunit conserved region
MTARIFRPAKTAMQSGSARTKEWLLVQDGDGTKSIDPLMGWTSSTGTDGQVQLAFDTKEDAVVYAESNGIAYSVIEPQTRKPVRKAYADNFKFGRIGSWTH